jgi:uncharacterized protein (TIGR03083 family)
MMPPILVAHLFPEVSRRLLALLRSLSPDEWHAPTVSSRRTVKDVVSHLLDGSLRRLSLQRDGYAPPDGSGGPRPGEPLVAFLDRVNGEWEAATRRLSPQSLIALTEWADAGLADLFRSLDPHAAAIFPVAWAGEEASENWMDVARDYTEKWHHTQQIFDATGRPSTITGRDLYHPCMDTFMRALPFTFSAVAAEDGTVVAVEVTGGAGGTWYVERHADRWLQMPESPRPATSTVILGPDTAWRLVTKRRDRVTVLAQFPDIRIEGDRALGEHVLGTVAVMA